MQGKFRQNYRVQQELDRNDSFEGHILLSDLPRLTSLLLAEEQNAADPVNLTVEFKRNQFGQGMISGHLSTELSVECQRCLQPMRLSVDQDFEFLIDASDEELESSSLDTVYSEDGYLNIYEVIEDELILGLPLIMMHEENNCNEFWSSADNVDLEAERPNPFAVLETLKQQKDQD